MSVNNPHCYNANRTFKNGNETIYEWLGHEKHHKLGWVTKSETGVSSSIEGPPNYIGSDEDAIGLLSVLCNRGYQGKLAYNSDGYSFEIMLSNTKSIHAKATSIAVAIFTAVLELITDPECQKTSLKHQKKKLWGIIPIPV